MRGLVNPAFAADLLQQALELGQQAGQELPDPQLARRGEEAVVHRLAFRDRRLAESRSHRFRSELPDEELLHVVVTALYAGGRRAAPAAAVAVVAGAVIAGAEAAGAGAAAAGADANANVDAVGVDSPNAGAAAAASARVADSCRKSSSDVDGKR